VSCSPGSAMSFATRSLRRARAAVLLTVPTEMFNSLAMLASFAETGSRCSSLPDQARMINVAEFGSHPEGRQAVEL